MEEAESKSKVKYEKIADMGSGLIIAKIQLAFIREQDINARIMKNETQRQLTENIKKRGQLESLPLCAVIDDRIEIISGHHRIRSARDAGMEEIFCVLDVSGLRRSALVAKQIAHNAINGFDDESTLKELAKMIDDVDDMIESYIGKDILGEPMEELEKQLAPSVEFDWKMVTFTFLPHQIGDMNKLVESIERTKPDIVGIADIEQHKDFVETLSRYQQFANVKNTGAAIHAMIQATKNLIPDLELEGSEEWVQITNIIGTGAIPSSAAETIKQAIDRMMEEGDISSTNKWQALEYLAADYLGKPRNKEE